MTLWPASSVHDTGYDPAEETYENAAAILIDLTFRIEHNNNYSGTSILSHVYTTFPHLHRPCSTAVRRNDDSWGFRRAVPHCLGLMGYSLDDLDRIAPIQVTATKGKREEPSQIQSRGC